MDKCRQGDKTPKIEPQGFAASQKEPLWVWLAALLMGGAFFLMLISGINMTWGILAWVAVLFIIMVLGACLEKKNN